jgi:hypothetical protein
VRHEDDGFGTVLDCILDRGEGAYDALVVGDLVALEGDVEVNLEVSTPGYASIVCLRDTVELTYTDEHALALEVDIADRELVGERHGGLFVGVLCWWGVNWWLNGSLK